ncbi:MAG: hypothetical protein AAGA92_13010 [Planctomycetota bacterium]
MAQRPEKREDLLRDARAMPRRVMLHCVLEPGGDELEVFAGFRSNGALSLYFGEDPVYQFNAAGELRRAFVDDAIVKADGGRLARWGRENRAGQVEMHRHDLTDDEQRALLERMLNLIGRLRQAILNRDYKRAGSVPEGELVEEQVAAWIAEHEAIGVADSAGVG